jgi:sodium/potassium-transporting ATPase subunit beta
MEGLVMGRNKSSWAKIGFFYVCFYTFLAAFFGAMLAVFLSTLTLPSDGGSPKLTQFIANKPGLTLVNKVESKYNASDEKTLNAHTKIVQDFLNKYDNYGKANKCNETQTTGYEGKDACRYDYATDMTPACDEKNYFGMENKQPCILIKMNKVFGWVPSGDSERLALVCKKGEEEVKVLNGGFLKAAMPFRGQPDYENPVAVLQAPKSSDTQKIRCELKGDGIEVSDTYNPKRAFGKIEITVAPPLA